MNNKAIARPQKSQGSKPATKPQPIAKKKIITVPVKAEPDHIGRAAKMVEPKEKPPVFRSLALFPGKLHLEDDRLFLKCPDGATFPILAIDQKFSLWLISHPGELFRSDDRLWLVYPKTSDSRICLSLKSIIERDRAAGLEVNQARIEGKLVGIDGDRFLIEIRRNLSRACFSELRSRNLINSSGLDSFVVEIFGDAPGKIGDFVQVNCVRDGDRLVRSESVEALQ